MIESIGLTQELQDVLEESAQVDQSALRTEGSEQDFYNSLHQSTMKFTNGTENLMQRDSYLKLLMAELENQNPLDPMEHDQMATQLAQFHSLQELTDMSENIAQLKELVQNNNTAGLNSGWFLKPGSQLQCVSERLSICVNPPESGLYDVVFQDSQGDVITSQQIEFEQGGLQMKSWSLEEFKEHESLPVRVLIQKDMKECPTYEIKEPIGYQAQDRQHILIDRTGEALNPDDYPIQLNQNVTEYLKTQQRSSL